MDAKRICIWLSLLVAVAVAARLGYCAAVDRLGHTHVSSYQEYVLTARRLLEHGTMLSPLPFDESRSTTSSLMPPAYVGLVAALYRLLGTETFTATLTLQIINAIVTSLAVPLVFLLAYRISGLPAAWLAAVAATVNPLVIGVTDYVWDTSLFTLCVTLCVCLAHRLSRTRMDWKRGFGFGLLLGGVALLNPALTIAYPLLVLWPLSKSCGWRLPRMLPGMAASALGWLVVVTPWTVRNYTQFGELIYIRGGFMLELWLGVCPQADSDGAAVYDQQFPYRNAEAQARVTSLGEHAFIKECGERAKTAIKADPWRLVRLVAVRAVDHWTGTVFTHSSPGKGGWPSSVPRAAATLFLSGELLIVVFCLLARQKIGSDLRWLLAIVVSVSIVYCLTHIRLYFRTPTEPIVGVIVAVLIVELLRSWTRGKSEQPDQSLIKELG